LLFCVLVEVGVDYACLVADNDSTFSYLEPVVDSAIGPAAEMMAIGVINDDLCAIRQIGRLVWITLE